MNLNTGMIHNTLVLVGQGSQRLSSLPATYEVHGNKWVGVILIIFGILFGTESVYVAIVSSLNGTFMNEFMGTKHLAFAPMAILFLAWGMNQFFISGELVIDRIHAVCKYKNLLGSHTWSDKISDYKGIQKRRETGDDSGSGQTLFYTIWLVNNKGKKSLKLYESTGSADWDEHMIRYQEMFGLPESV